MKNIKLRDLSVEVMKQLNSYKETTNESIKQIAKETATNIKKDIKNNAPKDSGKYSKGWRIKKVSERGNSISFVVYTPKGYRLSHLLEYGHAKRNGGRVRAYPHIKPAEEKGIKEFEKKIKESLKNG